VGCGSQHVQTIVPDLDCGILGLWHPKCPCSVPPDMCSHRLETCMSKLRVGDGSQHEKKIVRPQAHCRVVSGSVNVQPVMCPHTLETHMSQLCAGCGSQHVQIVGPHLDCRIIRGIVVVQPIMCAHTSTACMCTPTALAHEDDIVMLRHSLSHSHTRPHTHTRARAHAQCGRRTGVNLQ
jgi:hypothetical protein